MKRKVITALLAATMVHHQQLDAETKVGTASLTAQNQAQVMKLQLVSHRQVLNLTGVQQTLNQ